MARASLQVARGVRSVGRCELEGLNRQSDVEAGRRDSRPPATRCASELLGSLQLGSLQTPWEFSLPKRRRAPGRQVLGLFYARRDSNSQPPVPEDGNSIRD